MKKNILLIVALLICFFLLKNTGMAGEWNKIKDSNGIKLYERSIPNTDLKEYLAVTTIDARMEIIGEVLRDVARYPEWVSDCSSARILKKYDRNTFVMYLVLDPPVIEKRDIILNDETVYDYDNGNARIKFFCTDKEKIPAEKNRVRVTAMDGLFKMEYLGRNKTKFTYKLKTDPAGNISKRIAYAVMKNYPYDSLKKLKKMVADSRYANLAKGTEEETQINARSINAAVVRKVSSETMMKVANNKEAMASIIAADTQGIKNVTTSGGAYVEVEKVMTEACRKYIDKVVPDKRIAGELKSNKRMFDEIIDLITTSCDANETTIDSIINNYKTKI